MSTQQLINEINRLREGLSYIQKGKNLGYVNSYGRAQPDFPLDKYEMQTKAKKLLLETPISAMQADQLALSYSMKGHGRFMECVMGVVFLHGHLLPYDYAESVRKDYLSYETKMKAAGMPVKFITSFDEDAK